MDKIKETVPPELYFMQYTRRDRNLKELEADIDELKKIGYGG